MPRTREQVEQAVRRARVSQQRNAATRALNDPRRIANACRVVRAAVDHGVVTVEQVLMGDLIDLAQRMTGAETVR